MMAAARPPKEMKNGAAAPRPARAHGPSPLASNTVAVSGRRISATAGRAFRWLCTTHESRRSLSGVLVSNLQFSVARN
jgi:hypothetical protein